eukprot:tig00000147_g9495.t1
MRQGASNTKERRHRMVFLDAEMTGLNVSEDKLLEVAVVVTDADLQIIAEGPDIAIRHDEVVFENMNAWCKKHHTRSGLVDRCRSSSISEAEAEQAVLSFLRQWVDPGRATLCGNSVYVDRMFLLRHMPELAKFFHYRIVDISTIDELSRRWHPVEHGLRPQKRRQHRALLDIYESIDELRYYRATVFRAGGAGPAPRSDAASGPEGPMGGTDAAAGPDEEEDGPCPTLDGGRPERSDAAV